MTTPRKPKKKLQKCQTCRRVGDDGAKLQRATWQKSQKCINKQPSQLRSARAQKHLGPNLPRAQTQNRSPRSPPAEGLNVNFGSIIKSDSDFDKDEYSNYYVSDVDKMLGLDAFRSPGRPENKVAAALDKHFECFKQADLGQDRSVASAKRTR